MMFSTIQYEIDKDEWNKHIQKQSFSNAYQMADFYAPHCAAFDSEQFYITIEDTTGDIVGQLTGVIHNKKFLPNQSFDSIIMWHHGPIIHDEDNHNSILSSILSSIDKIAHEKKINLIKGSSPSISYQFPNNHLKQFGYSCQSWITYVTNIDRNIDQVYSSLHNKTRYDVRKGEEAGLKFEIITNREALDEYSELKLHDDKNKNKIIEQNKTFRDKRWELSIKNGWEKVYLARVNEKVVGGMANFLFNNNVIQHTIANSPDRKLNAGSFLTWNVIKSSIENNFLSYDMGGANPSPSSPKEEGIKHFKSKWGGQEYPYVLYTKIFNKMKMKFSNAIKNPSVIRRKFSKLYRN